MRGSYLYAAGVVVVWTLAWGSVSVANVASGLAVAAVVYVVIPERGRLSQRVAFRPVPLARLGWYLLTTSVTSNLLLARLAFSRGNWPPSGVVDVEIPVLSDAELTLVTNIMALSPGSLPVDVHRDTSMLSVHFIDTSDEQALRERVWRLVRLCQDAVGERS